MENIFHPSLIWFLGGLVMFILESLMPGLIILFFGVGAWIVSLVLLFLKLTLNVQLGIFILTSILSLVILRRTLKKVFFGHQKNEQNLEKEMNEFIGRKAIVSETITPQSGGKIEWNGTAWEAEAEEEIKTGEMVTIIKQDNLTFKVKKA